MPVNIQEYPPRIQSLPMCIRDNDNDDAFQENKEISPLTSNIKGVNNSKDKSSGSGNNNFTGKFFGTLKNLLPLHSGQENVETEDDGMEIPLEEVITGGEALRSQAESLLSPGDEQSVPQGWKGGMFQRLLVGAGILTGIGTLGGAGYKYYAGRSGSGAHTENTTQHYSTEPSLNPVDVYNRGEVTRGEVFTTLQPDGSTKSKSKHSRRHLPYSSPEIKANSELPFGILEHGKMSKEELLFSVAEYLLDGKNRINEERVMLLAKSIRTASDLFGEVKGKGGSLARAESIVRKWFFYNALGTQPEECILDILTNKEQSQDYVVGQIPSFLSLTKYLSLDRLSQPQLVSLNNLWRIFLVKDIPLLKVLDISVEGLKVRENDFFDLYVGTKAFDGFQTYSAEEAMEMGQVINHIASRNSASKKQINLLKIPYILSDNKNSTAKDVEGDKKKPDALEKYINDIRAVNEINNYIEEKYSKYSSAIELLASNDAMQNSSFTSLNGEGNSYINIPGDLPDEYWRLARSATDEFERLDEILTLAAFSELPENERNYISYPQVIVNHMSIKVQAQEPDLAKSDSSHINNIGLRENDVDLVSVILGEEERIYALKKKKTGQPAYQFIRVDRDILNYIKNGILNYDLEGCSAIGDNKFTCGSDVFSYSITPGKYSHHIDNKDNGIKTLIGQIVYDHKMNMHLYFDPSALAPVKRREFPDVVKQKIPFYDYIQANLEHKSTRHMLSCRAPSLLPMTVELAKIILSSGVLGSSQELTSDKSTIALSAAAKEELRGLVAEGYLNKKIMDIEQQIAAISGYLFDGVNSITENEERILLLAREILDNADFFKGKTVEEISVVQAKLIIRLWFFDTLMGKQPDNYILDAMSINRLPQGYTVGDVSDFLDLFNFFNKDGFSDQQLASVHSVWHSLLMDKLPFLKLKEKTVKNMSLWDFNFSNLYAGTQFLESRSFQDYTADEAMKIGEMLWDIAGKEHSIEGKNNLFKMPALIFIESGNSKINNRSKFYKFLAVNEYINFRDLIKEAEERVEKKYNDYLSALKIWFNDVQNKKTEEDDDMSSTFKVMHEFQLIDKHLILSAFGGLPYEEREFISSPQAKIYRADINIEIDNPVSGRSEYIYKKRNDVDVISVWVNNIERIYAIKNKVNNLNVRQFIRLERDVQSFVSNRVLDSGSDDKIIISDNDNIICNLELVSENLLGDGVDNNIEFLADKFSLDHGVNIFYNFQYPIDSSVKDDDKWSLVKNGIPFSERIKNDSIQSLPPYFMNQARLSSTIDFHTVMMPENISAGVQLILSNKSRSVVPAIEKMESKEEQLLAVADYLFDGNNGITDNAEAIERLAINILAESDLYGGERGEGISIAQAKSAIRQWFFYNILETCPEYYIYNKLYEGRWTPGFIVHILHNLLSIDNFFSTDSIPEAQLSALRTVWSCLLKEEMPFLKFSEESVKRLDVRGNDFANLYTGARYLEANLVQDYTPDEAMNVGVAMWDVAVTEGISINEASLFKTPIQYYVNSTSLDSKYQSEILDLISINEYIKFRQVVGKQYEKTLAAAGSWLSKGGLAYKIISECPATRTIYYHRPFRSSPGEWTGKDKEYYLKEAYLNGSDKPCPTAPDSLSDEYQKQTENVSNNFKELDKLLLINALNKLKKNDRDFITSPEAIISPIKLEGFDPKSISFRTYQTIKTELISVKLNEEERIYALRRGNADNPDDLFFRVDFNILKYYENKIIYNHHYIRFSWTKRGESKISSSGNVFENIAEVLSEKTRLNIYKSLYELGNEQSDVQAIWSIIQDFIPFYTCIESSINHNFEQAIPACIIDGISLIPAIGQAARLGVKTAKAGIIGFNAAKMGVKTRRVINLAAAGLPGKAEVTALGKSMIGAFDPGFELVARGSRALTHNILNFIRSNKKMTNTVAKITAVEGGYKQIIVLPEKATSALLPGIEMMVPVVPVGEKSGLKIYVRFNEETGEKFGRKYFITKSNKLEPVPVSLAERIKKIQNEGLGGKGSKSAPAKWDAQKSQGSEGKDKASEVLTDGEMNALYHYGRQYHSTVNGFMIAGMPEQYVTKNYRDGVYETVMEIKSALKKLPPYDDWVYRGGSINSRNFNRLKKGSLVSNHGFLSSSTDFYEARIFKHAANINYVPVVYTIRVKKSGHLISEYTLKPREKEVLIDSDSFFRVIDFNHKSILIEEIDMPSVSQVDVPSLSQAEKDSIIYIDEY